MCVFSSTEKEEKAEPEPKPEVKEEEPEVKEEPTVQTKAKKEKKHAEEGFELWNELEVQRIKFMVSSSPLLYIFLNIVTQKAIPLFSWNTIFFFFNF